MTYLFNDIFHTLCHSFSLPFFLIHQPFCFTPHSIVSFIFPFFLLFICRPGFLSCTELLDEAISNNNSKKKIHFLVPVCPLSLSSGCLSFSVFLPQIVFLPVRAWHAPKTTIKVLKVGLRPQIRVDAEKYSLGSCGTRSLLLTDFYLRCTLDIN